MQPDAARIRLSALLGLAAIILGSMGAHGKVHDLVQAAGHLDNWKTAVLYHLAHAAVLLMLGFAGTAGGKRGQWAWNILFLGVLLFSGSLYVHALTQIRWLVYVTPVGGVSMMAGWALVLAARWKRA